MISLSRIQSIQELTIKYRQLARVYHPDCGGNTQLMQQLNAEYQQRKLLLEKDDNGFNKLTVGDKIYVNGTVCTVILITKTRFVAKAKGRSKQAWFNIKTGIGIDFPFYKASILP
ncbi:MAG: hypothetical protein KAH17_01790 [Bacteroidales bacterium]|nr:hypothetical protein [Bacteroidales bacterium]